MNSKTLRGTLLLVGLLALSSLACSTFLSSDGPPSNAVVVEVAANSSAMGWLESAALEFNLTETETSDGNPIYVIVSDVEAGQAVADYVGGNGPTMWVPDNQVWVNIMDAQGNGAYQGNCVSTAESPLVIGMWRGAAESLGYPGLSLGWLDIGSLAADENAWAYYSGGEYGDRLRISHGHPGLAASGASTLLAIVQAAESKTEAVSAEDISKPIVQASVGAFESAVASFNSSTDALGAAMSDRGPTYLGAGIMYESTVVQHGNGEWVAIYPVEGTFVATHPACISSEVSAEEQAAASIFRDYLLSEEGQSMALAFGLRPVNDAVAIGAPIDASYGVDPSQPTTVFAPPSVETVYAVQDVWQSARKPINLVMLLDTSGSMSGRKIDNMKQAAAQFVQQMGEEDRISLIDFHSYPDVKAEYVLIAEGRDQIVGIIEEMVDGGDTTLFDAVGKAGDIIATTTTPDMTNVIIVLTDGQDTGSLVWEFDDELAQHATANDTTIYAIAYGSNASEEVLAELARMGNGNYYLSDEASIAGIYEEMSAAFGGSVGVGR